MICTRKKKQFATQENQGGKNNLMNVYLDIDGVIVGTASPQEDIVELLEYILGQYPHSAYWLTTHCRWGENRCADWLEQNGLPSGLVARLDKQIKPTHWKTLKTEAIDFGVPFVWLEDAPLYSERAVLQQHHALDSICIMNKKDEKMAAKALAFLKERGNQA